MRTIIATLLALALAAPAYAQAGHIKANNGLYICAEQGGGLGSDRKDALIANRSAALGWETFTREPQADGSFFLKTFNGNYVEAVNGGGGAVTTTATGKGAWGQFRLSLDGSIVTADGRHRLTVRTDLGAPYVDATGVLPGGTFRFE